MDKEYSNSKIISSRPYFEILLVKYTHIVLIVVLCGYCLWEVFEGGSFDYSSTSIEFLVPFISSHMGFNQSDILAFRL